MVAHVRPSSLLRAGLMFLFLALFVGVAWAYTAPVTTCATVDGTTGGAIIPTSPLKGRKLWGAFCAGAARAYCQWTTTATCSPAASSTNYALILESGGAADTLGTHISYPVDGSYNICCAASSTTKVCVEEGKE